MEIGSCNQVKELIDALERNSLLQELDLNV